MKRSLFISKNILIVDSDLANMLGINKAVILQQIHYWTEKNEELGRNLKDGHYWVYNTFESWGKQFKWIGVRTIKKLIKELEDDGYLITGTFNKSSFDHTKWYRINYDKVDVLLGECNNFTIGGEKSSPAIPKTNITETNTETNNGDKGKMVGTAAGFSHSTAAPAEKSPHAEPRKSDPAISDFIKWYFRYYEMMECTPHPPIKSAQKIRVHDQLKAFMDTWDLTPDAFKDMAEAFFAVETSDHNINHFATEGILTNRFYEAIY